MLSHSAINRLGFAHMVGFTDPSTGWIDWTKSSPTKPRDRDSPFFLHLQELHQPALLHKIAQEPILYSPQNGEIYQVTQPHTIDDMNSFNATSFRNVWNDSAMADEKSEILTWLSPLEPQRRHQDIRTRRVDKVGDWLLQTQEYRNWFGGIREDESNGSALFCCGGPGVGKTYIR